MAKKTYTLEELKELARDYFTSNPDVDHLVASTHDGVFYRPENAGYCQSNANSHGGELVRVDRFNEATTLATQAVNCHASHLVASKGGAALDVVDWFRIQLVRVANGEAVEDVLKDLLAEFTTDLPEFTDGLEGNGGEGVDFPDFWPYDSALDQAVATALHLPGFLSQPTSSTDAPATDAPASTDTSATSSTDAPATSSTPAPASTDAPAPAAPKRNYTKKATASTTAKATKVKSTAKASGK